MFNEFEQTNRAIRPWGWCAGCALPPPNISIIVVAIAIMNIFTTITHHHQHLFLLLVLGMGVLLAKIVLRAIPPYSPRRLSEKGKPLRNLKP